MSTSDAENEKSSEKGEQSSNTDTKTAFRYLRSSSSKWEQLIAAAFVLGLAVLCGFGINRLAVYWSKDTSNYYNPNYATDDNVDAVIVHATLGFVAFLLVPAWIVVDCFLSTTKSGLVSLLVSILAVAAMIATFATVPLIKDTVITDQSGTAVTITAVVWAIWWVVTCVLSGFALCCKCWDTNGRFGPRAWWIRHMGMTVFGFALLPIFYALSGDLVGSALALISLFVVCLLLSEWIVWRGFSGNVAGDASEVAVSQEEGGQAVEVQEEAGPIEARAY